VPARAGRAAAVLVATAVGLAACGSSGPSAAQKAAQQAYLGQILDAVPSLNQLRTTGQLVNLGDAVCSGFAAGENYPTLADRIALNDGDLSTSDLGTIITAAAQNLCPKYSAQVDS
jgi:hypothetical protein